MKQDLIFAAVDKHRQMILDAERYIWHHPEPGYQEWETSRYLAEQFERLGYTLRYAGNIPGFCADIDTGRPGPKIVIFGEMDSLVIPTHPECNPETGAVHACGHNAQSATLLGIAAALREPGVLDGLCGSIRLCAVPAEEMIQLDYRAQLRKQGTIGYFSGKIEFMHRGFMDGADMAFMCHVTGGDSFWTIAGFNGCVLKTVTYEGVATHAGGSPERGVNALYAANLGMNAVNALRETFRDTDHVRVHPIITAGGSVVNTIPDKVTMETYVRAENVNAIVRENNKVNRALAASAAALGANVVISDRPGNLPMHTNVALAKLGCDVAGQVLGEGKASYSDYWSGGSTDLGDVSTVMPVAHFFIGGQVGDGHSETFYIKNPELCCVTSAKIQMMLLATLLENDAERGKKIIADARPVFPSIAAYFETVDPLFKDVRAVTYRDDGAVELHF